MQSVAVILARGGSKGIPRKNLIEIKGKPLIYYSILAAKNAGLDVYVSSECNEILDIALKYTAIPFHRDPKFATDVSKSEDALIEFSKSLENNCNVVFIQPTSPFINSSYIRKGLDMMNKYDSVLSAYKEHWFPRWTLDAVPIGWDINNRPRRQDKKEVYVENGAFYISTRDNILDSKLRYSGNIGILEMLQEHSFQIDTPDDINLVSKLL